MIVASGKRRLAFVLATAIALAGCGGGGEPEAGLAPEPGAEPESPLGARVVIETSDGEVIVQVEVADTREERERGLMGREQLPEDEGMVFLHRRPTAGGFWMKDTLIPLSLAVWDESGEILAILKMRPCRADQCTVYDPGVAWVAALEVNLGFFDRHGVEVGDTARFEP